ncbi:MAG TPA: helix-turn-helix domain-containing protein [Solirubrobacteraceae bacterium]|jgi:AcrR family transcriptional regulator/DNA-binding MarR family transcriptional regulator
MRGDERQGGERRETRDGRATRGSGSHAKQGLRRATKSRGPRLGRNILALQRSRLLSAAVNVIAEHGYNAASVATICERAGVSRRTYYEIFENREECLVAILTDTEKRVAGELAPRELKRAKWPERVRGGLWTLLSMAEAEPALARVCMIETQRASGLVSAERGRIVARLVELLDEGRSAGGESGSAGALTAEALIGAITTVIAARLTRVQHDRGAERSLALRELLRELMSMIALHYLGPAAARRELSRPLPEALTEMQSEEERETDGADPLAGLPMRLTYRTARVLHAVASLDELERGPSNRQIGEHAEVADPGQISKLLSRLERNGLLVNATRGNEGKGEANSWSLTETGRRLVRGIGAAEALRTYRRAA